jgi:hypothetical protein
MAIGTWRCFQRSQRPKKIPLPIRKIVLITEIIDDADAPIILDILQKKLKAGVKIGLIVYDSMGKGSVTGLIVRISRGTGEGDFAGRLRYIPLENPKAFYDFGFDYEHAVKWKLVATDDPQVPFNLDLME